MRRRFLQGRRAPVRVVGGLLLLWLALPAGAPAQRGPVRFSETASRLRQASTPAALQRPAAPHYDVVALRVEFQPDTTRFTTGDGTFDGPLYAEGLLPKVDPLPHDAAYFQAHLDFLADYVAQVSDGRTTVTTHLLPAPVRVSQAMGAYSPTGFEADTDEQRARLAALVAEAWQTASAQIPFDLTGFDPERTAFVLFHAGVGRDIELLGTTLDKTPLDLPSLFFDEQALTKLGAGNLSFHGFPVRNTLVMPRTETRQAFDFIDDQPFLLELSINGLLAASFFNFLGVPDLFNTETGDPAIGPFGLMDPLGIFAYNGLFPPEPSAWTKVFLAWADPQDLLGQGPEQVTLSANKAEAPPAIARAVVSAAEYFLVENRNRDPEGDGLVLRVWQHGALVEQRVQNGDEGFTRFDVSGFIGGVVVGVDHYDWALPGGLDEDGNTLNGGLLIWHVDERRLAEGLAANRVNADPERRAIDLEEADSAQDLGFPSNNPFGPGADQGTPFDFFFKDNPVTAITATGQLIRLYQNRFGPDTVPNSHTNAGGPSFIVLEDFSEPGPQMSFTSRREAEAGVAPLAPFSGIELDRAFGPGASLLEVPLTASSSALLWHTGTAQWGGIAPNFGAFILEADAVRTGTAANVLAGPALLPGEVPGEDRVVVVQRPDPGTQLLLLPPAGFADPQQGGEVDVFDLDGVGARLPASPVLVAADGSIFVLFDGEEGAALARVDTRNASVEVTALQDEVLALAGVGGGDVALVGRAATRLFNASERWTYTLSDGASVGQPAFGRDRSGLVGVVPVTDAGELLVLLADGAVQRLDPGRYAGDPGDAAALNAFPVLADLDEDGRLDVLTTYGADLVAFSQHGALVRGFPIRLPAPSVAQPLVAQLSESGAWSVVVASTNGYVYAYDLGRGGRQVPGFPLAVGASGAAPPLLQAKKMYAVSAEGSLRAWALDGLEAVWWGQLYGNAQHQNYVALAEEPPPQPSPQAAGLIVEAETYNWPNPVRDGRTFLRCMTRRDARVRITIIDAAGSLLDDLELDLRGGAPTEHLWQTDAASGLYYARVTATGADGTTDTRLIKMAIIR